MKALTLWQPYASLVAAGVKRVETRSWGTAYRGPLAIHAALRADMDVGADYDRCRRAYLSLLARGDLRPQHPLAL